MSERIEVVDWRDIEDARAEGHAAADKCAKNAGNDFREAALEAVREYATRGKAFTVEDVRAASGIGAHDDRAWGGVIRKAARLGYVKACGAVPVASSRGGFKTQWRAA